MCGRYVITLTWAELVALVRATETGTALNDLPRFNIAPTQQVPILRAGGKGRLLTSARWGLVPGWAREDLGGKLINARGETVHEKASFRDAFRSRRCLLPASGFYEWRREGKRRRPFHFTAAEGGLMGFAGLWEDHPRLGLTTCTIVTVAANDDVARLHDRMPLVLEEGSWDAWLGDDTVRAAGLLATPPAGRLRNQAVGDAVNSPANEGPSLIVADADG